MAHQSKTRKELHKSSKQIRLSSSLNKWNTDNTGQRCFLELYAGNDDSLLLTMLRMLVHAELSMGLLLRSLLTSTLLAPTNQASPKV